MFGFGLGLKVRKKVDDIRSIIKVNAINIASTLEWQYAGHVA